MTWRHQEFWRSNSFPSLDGIRAIAVLLVVAYHIHPLFDSHLLIYHWVNGHLGVDAFLVLSGFLITTLLLREERERGGINLRAFYIRRVFRILPLYFLAIATYLVVGLLPGQRDTWIRTVAGLPYFLTLRNEYIPPNLPVTLGHTWSLPVEEKFYFLWPLLFFIVLRRYRWAVLLCIPLLYFGVRESLLFTSYLSILFGCGVAVAMESIRDHHASTVKTAALIPSWAVVGVGMGVYCAAVADYGRLKALFAIYCALLIPYLLLRESTLSMILGSNVFTWIGRRSYAIYLFHRIGSNVFERQIIVNTEARYTLVFVLASLAAMALSAVTYTLVEQPLIRLGRSLAMRTVTVSAYRASA